VSSRGKIKSNIVIKRESVNFNATSNFPQQPLTTTNQTVPSGQGAFTFNFVQNSKKLKDGPDKKKKFFNVENTAHPEEVNFTLGY
jgi:hypothetical protein